MTFHLSAFFDPDRPPRDGFLGLVLSDYLAACRGSGESSRELARKFIPRMVNNPSLHAAVLLRVALASPKVFFGFWRSVLIALHSIDVEGPVEVGPGLLLPHPIGIVFGRGTRIGRDVRILNHVTLGARPGRSFDHGRVSPTVGDRVTIWAQAIVVGPITVGDEAVIGARSWVDKDVEPGTVIRGDLHRAA